MPPKTDLKACRKILLEMRADQPLFYRSFQVYSGLAEAKDSHSEQASAKFNVLRDRFIDYLNRLSPPEIKRALTNEQRDSIADIQVKIGLGFYYENKCDQAKDYFNKAKEQDFNLDALLNLAAIETCPVKLQDIRESLLHSACQPKHCVQASKVKPTLMRHAYSFLNSLLAQSSAEPKEFYKKYAQLLGIPGIERIIHFYKEKQDAKKQAYWRGILFKALASHGGQTIADLQAYLAEQGEYLFRQKKYLELFEFLKTKSNLFIPDELALLSNILLIQADKLPKEAVEFGVHWLTLGAETSLNSDVTYAFLQAFADNKRIFDAEKSVTILRKASESKIEKVVGLSNVLLGALFYEGYPTLPKDFQRAFICYQRAAQLGHVPAVMKLAYMHLHGQGTTQSYSQALMLYEQAHRLGDDKASLLWARLLFNALPTYSPERRKTLLAKALVLLRETEARLLHRSEGEQTSLMEECAEVAYTIGTCLLFEDSLGSIQSVISPTEDRAALKAIVKPIAHEKNAEVIKHFQFAATHGSEDIRFKANHQLGSCYFYGLHIEQDLVKASAAVQQAIAINKEREGYDASHDYYLLLLCSVILKLQSERETGTNQKTSQYQALAYFQQAISIRDEDLPQEISALAEHLYRRNTENTVNHERAYELFQLISKKQESQRPWQEEVSELKKLLNSEATEKTPATLILISQSLERIDERLLDDKTLLPMLSHFVGDCVTRAGSWNEAEIREVFRAVGRWHLTAASAALEPLFMYLQDYLTDLSFEHWCLYIKFFAQCNFSPAQQAANVLPLLERFQAEVLPKALNTGQYTIKDAARLFYGLSLLDCNQPNPLCLSLAETIYTAMQSTLHQLKEWEVSEVYHACHYFSLHYPNDKQWPLVASCFYTYAHSLLEDNAIQPSKTQARIHQRLLQLNKNTQQEVFIEEAGRRVDFVVDGIVLQYNGARRHFVFDNDGKAHRSLKDRLAIKTLKKVACVACIDRLAWDALGGDEQAELTFLRGLIADAKALQAKRPFFPSGSERPRIHVTEGKDFSYR